MNSGKRMNHELYLFVGCILVFFIWISFPYLFKNLFQIKNPESTSELADLFNFTSGLFSGLAFVLILITFYLQKEDIKQNEHSQKESIENMKKQNDISKSIALFQGLTSLIEDQKMIIKKISQQWKSQPIDLEVDTFELVEMKERQAAYLIKIGNEIIEKQESLSEFTYNGNDNHPDAEKLKREISSILRNKYYSISLKNNLEILIDFKKKQIENYQSLIKSDSE